MKILMQKISTLKKEARLLKEITVSVKNASVQSVRRKQGLLQALST